jgi:hypothetical protein
MELKQFDPLPYQQIIKDIISYSAQGNDPQVQDTITNMCRIYSDFLGEFTARTNGYMVLTAFLVSFTEMKKTISVAEGDEKVLLHSLVQSIIGSFGRVVN